MYNWNNYPWSNHNSGHNNWHNPNWGYNNWHNPWHNPNWSQNNWHNNPWHNPNWGQNNWNNNDWNDNNWGYNRLNPYYRNSNSQDYGPNPFVVDIEKVTKQNKNYRTALWTGEHLQLTLMNIVVGGDIGLEVHPNLDQFIRIEEGQGLVQMGDSKDNLDFEEEVYADYAFVIPAGKWHNLTNTGNKPIKLYSIYAPPQHPYGTIHETKEVAMAAEENHY